MTLSFARGCCKAYHPECVGQDSTILETNERWICGKPFITSPSAILTGNFFFSNLVGSICTFRIRQILYGALLRKRASTPACVGTPFLPKMCGIGLLGSTHCNMHLDNHFLTFDHSCKLCFSLSAIPLSKI